MTAIRNGVRQIDILRATKLDRALTESGDPGLEHGFHGGGGGEGVEY